MLTLTTLTIGGAIFIAIFSVQTSIMRTIDDVLNNLYNFDLIIILERPYRDDHVVQEAHNVSGITHIESWRQQNVRRVYADESESLNIVLNALPPDTTMVNPDIITGRWLLPQDQNAIVLSSGVLNKDPDIAVGDDIVLKIDGEDIVWQVVGISKGFGPQREAYVHYDYHGWVVGKVHKTNQLRIQTSERNLAFQSAVGNTLKEHLKKRSIGVSGIALVVQYLPMKEVFLGDYFSVKDEMPSQSTGTPYSKKCVMRWRYRCAALSWGSTRRTFLKKITASSNSALW